jgi:hypothetical protein
VFFGVVLLRSFSEAEVRPQQQFFDFRFDMKINFKKIFVTGILVAALFLPDLGGRVLAQEVDREAILAQIRAVERQILLLNIELIKVQIADLQSQLGMAKNFYIDVLFPVGGENLENRKTYSIRWDYKNADKIDIELEYQGNITKIAGSVPAADKKYDWYIGSIAGNDYRIKIKDFSRPEVFGKSAEFSIFDNSKHNKCSDGTLMGECSKTKPQFCLDADLGLINSCKTCGCPSGKSCASNGFCR